MIRCKLLERPFDSVINEFYFEKSPEGIGSSIKRNNSDYIFKNEKNGIKPTIDGDECFHEYDIEIEWEIGQFNELKNDTDFMTRKPIHLHANLTFLNKVFHVDYYGLGHYGPGSSLQEILLFDENGLIKRGGKGNVSFAGFTNNWPLLLKFNDFYLCFTEFPSLKDRRSYKANVYTKI